MTTSPKHEGKKNFFDFFAHFNDEIDDKKLKWKLLDLLIIPLVAFIGGVWIEQMINNRDVILEEQRALRQIEVENKRHEKELEALKIRHQQSQILGYFDTMKAILIETEIGLLDEDQLNNKQRAKLLELKSIAQARTATVLRDLNKERRNLLLGFLKYANLGFSDISSAALQPTTNDLTEDEQNLDQQLKTLTKAPDKDLKAKQIRGNLYRKSKNCILLANCFLTGINLKKADLNGADLRLANLNSADLIEADLTNAILSSAKLSGAQMEGVKLNNAYLKEAKLTVANLKNAHLNGAKLANANLTGANLEKADLTGAELTGTNFTAANLTKASVDISELGTATLCNTTMPNGEKSNRNCSKK